jgi:DNA-binding response OmpR family regulator
MSRQVALIVISEAVMRDFLIKHLKSMGFRCNTAATVQEGQHLIQHDQPDIILINSKLAGENGIALVEYVKNNKQTATPMIMLSYTEEENVAGVEVLPRPVQISALRSCIKKSIKRI